MNKPDGKWKCRACGSMWDGSQLVIDPMSTAAKWTCGDYFCGGTCDRVRAQQSVHVDDASTGLTEQEIASNLVDELQIWHRQ